jgi:hypothetical protein
MTCKFEMMSSMCLLAHENNSGIKNASIFFLKGAFILKHFMGLQGHRIFVLPLKAVANLPFAPTQSYQNSRVPASALQL